MPSAVRLREDYSAEELRRRAPRRRTPTRAGGFCRWRRSATGWTAARRRGSAAWTARRCATGSIASTQRGRRACSTIGRRARSRACRRSNWPSSRDRRGRARPREGRRRALAADRSQARHRREDSASTITSAMSESFSRSSASRTSAPGPRHPAQDERIVEAFKKTSRRAERPSRRRPEGQAGRDLVSGRGPDRPEERPRPPMGQARNAAKPARRPAL